MEAFDFAVGLGTIRPGALVAGTGGSHGFTPLAAAVAAAVVGEYPLDGHTTLCEPGVGTLVELCCCAACFVCEYLRIGDPAVIIDSTVGCKRIRHAGGSLCCRVRGFSSPLHPV